MVLGRLGIGSERLLIFTILLLLHFHDHFSAVDLLGLRTEGASGTTLEARRLLAAILRGRLVVLDAGRHLDGFADGHGVAADALHACLDLLSSTFVMFVQLAGVLRLPFIRQSLLSRTTLHEDRHASGAWLSRIVSLGRVVALRSSTVMDQHPLHGQHGILVLPIEGVLKELLDELELLLGLRRKHTASALGLPALVRVRRHVTRRVALLNGLLRSALLAVT